MNMTGKIQLLTPLREITFNDREVQVRKFLVIGEDVVQVTAYGKVAHDVATFQGRTADVQLYAGKHGWVLNEASSQPTGESSEYLYLDRDGLVGIDIT